jgi:hypothetical protein
VPREQKAGWKEGTTMAMIQGAQDGDGKNLYRCLSNVSEMQGYSDKASNEVAQDLRPGNFFLPVILLSGTFLAAMTMTSCHAALAVTSSPKVI